MNNDTPFGAFLAVLAVGFALSLLLSRAAIHLGMRWRLIDEPRGRHRHRRTVSKFGGLALWGAFTIAALVAQALPVPRTDPMELVRVTGLLLGGTFCFLFGILDDRFEFKWLPQYVAQLGAASVAVVFQIFIQYVNNPFTDLPTEEWPHLVTVFVTVLWMGIMINAVNFMDGLDGLAAGVAGIAAVVLFINGVFRLDPPQHSVGLLPAALIGATLGFLPFNFAPARVFMGSSGSMFLGYTVGALAIIGGAKMATILLVMGLPLLDFAWVVANRIRLGRNPLSGDRSHLHFRLLDLGLTQRQIVLGYWAFSALFGALTLVTTSRVFKLAALVAMGVLVLVGFALLQVRAEHSND
ncbi:MAG: undecaprenyl/decaprenyl-phosphate alpha-N-acetylglucosaminyl 1-phosphate transferase [Anaerolineae bacterium]|nr:undecaprenyl/decaprenyl-phosphate alpha-N-acetylglucosaminyl 1-phosphate transferase [Anaerolineae bacterium]